MTTAPASCWLGLFPKFLRQLPAPELMAACRQAGLDGPLALVREGYWTEPERLAATLPDFVRVAAEARARVAMAFTDYPLARLAESSRLWAEFAAQDLKLVCAGKFNRRELPQARQLRPRVRVLVERCAEQAARHGARLLLHLHGGDYPHSATAAFELVRDLDPQTVGVMIDPGNNYCQEGSESVAYQLDLLGEYLAAVGVKSARPFRRSDRPGGWDFEWCPLFAGAVDWRAVQRELARVGFIGPYVFMPFYHEQEPVILRGVLKEEVQWFRQGL